MAQNQNHNDDHEHHHIIPFDVLSRVCVALLILTVLTVATARMHLGVLATPIAFAIALVKALLVMAFFMGLKYDVKLNRIIFGTGFFGLLLLFFFCALDIWTRIGQGSTL